MTEILTNTEHLMQVFLTGAQEHINAACDPATPEADFKWHGIVAGLAGTCAYLLNELQICDQGDADEVAEILDERAADQEWLADWVGEQLNTRGIDVEALITAREPLPETQAEAA